MKQSNETRDYNIGKSDYAKHKIQPWDIWKEYNLNPWDADIVKRVLRTKEGEERSLDYEKIIHICKERIRQISEEDAAICKPLAKSAYEGNSEEDEHTILVRCESHKPPMISYPNAECVKYAVYGVFEADNAWYAYLGHEDGGNVYLKLSNVPGSWAFTEYDGFPKHTFKLGKTLLGEKFRNYISGYEISLKLGKWGTDYEKGDYIISNGLLYRYMGIRSCFFKGGYADTHKYVMMVNGRRFSEVFASDKFNNEAVQQ